MTTKTVTLVHIVTNITEPFVIIAIIVIVR